MHKQIIHRAGFALVLLTAGTFCARASTEGDYPPTIITSCVKVAVEVDSYASESEKPAVVWVQFTPEVQPGSCEPDSPDETVQILFISAPSAATCASLALTAIDSTVANQPRDNCSASSHIDAAMFEQHEIEPKPAGDLRGLTSGRIELPNSTDRHLAEFETFFAGKTTAATVGCCARRATFDLHYLSLPDTNTHGLKNGCVSMNRAQGFWGDTKITSAATAAKFPNGVRIHTWNAEQVTNDRFEDYTVCQTPEFNTGFPARSSGLEAHV